MNKKLVFGLGLLCIAGSMPAMQQQQQKQKEQDQQNQKQKKKDKQKQKDNNNDGESPKDVTAPDADFTDLNAMLSVIMNDITQAHGSVTGMMTNLKHKEHKRICPTCGRPAEECSVDRGRISHGNIMLCGCPLCGGLQV